LQVKLQALQEESQGEVERLQSLLAGISSEHTAVTRELEMAAPAGMPISVRFQPFYPMIALGVHLT
jgi:hypothetical protein